MRLGFFSGVGGHTFLTFHIVYIFPNGPGYLDIGCWLYLLLRRWEVGEVT